MVRIRETVELGATIIMAPARKLLIVSWRMATTGEIPKGVILRPAA
jgi:transposase